MTDGMNFMDYSFVAILILSCFAGMYQGLVRMVVGIASMIATFFISIHYYPNLAHYIKVNTPVYKLLKQSTSHTIDGGINSVPGMANLTQLNDSIVNTLIGNIPVPPVIRKFIMGQVNIDITNINTSQIVDTLSTKAADVFVNILALIALFAFVQFIFTIIQIGLSAFFTLPILTEINLLGGGAFGIVQGFVTLYVICAAWSMLAGAPMYREVFRDLNTSKYAKWFYDNNLLLDVLVKYKIL